jgi:HD-GYP domain-containing protein (c-di-GMP phosphodiesterase class II)
VRAASAAKSHVVPVFAPKLESQTRESLSVLLMQMGILDDAPADRLQPLRACVESLLDAVYDDIGQAFDLDTHIPVRDHHYAHPAKVAELSMILTRLGGGGRMHARIAGTAALLMNCGYVDIDQAILERAGPLPESQTAIVRTHPQLSVRLLAHAELAQDILDAVAQHHERWDGSGYPEGRAGRDVSTYARIIAAADAWVAMSSPRPHRAIIPRAEIEDHFRQLSGEQFDPRVVRLLLDDLPERYDT